MLFSKHNNSLKGKVAIVTGVGRGIGKAIALLLAEYGCKVVICSRTEKELKETEKEIKKKNADVLAVKADVSELQDIKNEEETYRIILSQVTTPSFKKEIERELFRFQFTITTDTRIG